MVMSCTGSNGKPGFRGVEGGECHTFNMGNERSRQIAKNRAQEDALVAARRAQNSGRGS